MFGQSCLVQAAGCLNQTLQGPAQDLPPVQTVLPGLKRTLEFMLEGY